MRMTYALVSNHFPAALFKSIPLVCIYLERALVHSQPVFLGQSLLKSLPHRMIVISAVKNAKKRAKMAHMNSKMTVLVIGRLISAPGFQCQPHVGKGGYRAFQPLLGFMLHAKGDIIDHADISKFRGQFFYLLCIGQ